MDLDEWLPIYEEIVTTLGLSKEADEKATYLLHGSLQSNERIDDPVETIRELSRSIKGSTCFVFGTSMDLEREIEMVLSHIPIDDERTVIIAADGATSVLLLNGVIPDVIVTDLDGGVKDQIECTSKGSFMIIHAHGDNVQVVKRTISDLSGKVIQSTQVDPGDMTGVINFGGFTDGDRAVHIASSLGAGKIVLVGFDLETVGEKIYNGGLRKNMTIAQQERKRIKLDIAKRIIDMVKEIPVEQFHLDSHDPRS